MKRTRVLLSAVFSLLAVLAVFGLTRIADALSDGPSHPAHVIVEIRNVDHDMLPLTNDWHSWLRLEDQDHRSRWEVIPVSDGLIALRNVSSGRYLRAQESRWVSAGSTRIGLANKYLWQAEPNSKGETLLRNVDTDRYLDADRHRLDVLTIDTNSREVEGTGWLLIPIVEPALELPTVVLPSDGSGSMVGLTASVGGSHVPLPAAPDFVVTDAGDTGSAADVTAPADDLGAPPVPTATPTPVDVAVETSDRAPAAAAPAATAVVATPVPPTAVPTSPPASSTRPAVVAPPLPTATAVLPIARQQDPAAAPPAPVAPTATTAPIVRRPSPAATAVPPTPVPPPPTATRVPPPPTPVPPPPTPVPPLPTATPIPTATPVPAEPTPEALTSGSLRIVVGSVSNGTTGVAGASVTVGGAQAITDVNGDFFLLGVPVGGSSISISAPGFSGVSFGVNIPRGEGALDLGVYQVR